MKKFSLIAILLALLSTISYSQAPCTEGCTPGPWTTVRYSFTINGGCTGEIEYKWRFLNCPGQRYEVYVNWVSYEGAECNFLPIAVIDMALKSLLESDNQHPPFPYPTMVGACIETITSTGPACWELKEVEYAPSHTKYIWYACNSDKQCCKPWRVCKVSDTSPYYEATPGTYLPEDCDGVMGSGQPPHACSPWCE